jgi:hypothetical protein
MGALADPLISTSDLPDVHETCDGRNEVATASLTEVWIDKGDRRICFL